MIKRIEIEARELDGVYSKGSDRGFKIKREKLEVEVRKIKIDYILFKGGYQTFEVHVPELLAAISAILEYGEPIKLIEKKIQKKKE